MAAHHYLIHHTYYYDNHCEFIHYNGTKYFADCHDEKIRKKLSEVFPVIENPFNSEDWFYYYMGLGGGLVFVHKKIAELFKQKIGKESLPCEDGPYDEEAMETIKENADKQDMNVSEYTRQLLDKSLNEENND